MVKAAAAGGPDGLQLKSFQACCVSTAMLSCLSRRHLTSLIFESVSPADDTQQVADILATRLTALQQLRLKTPKLCVGLLPALRSLSNLEELELGGVAEQQLGDLHFCLPDCLKLLTLHGFSRRQGSGGSSSSSQPVLHLGHLTALTQLNGPMVAIPIAEGDVLPPNLPCLEVLGCSTVQPLLPLTQLRSLSIRSCSVSAAGLQVLGSHLSNLLDVPMEFASREAVEAAAAGLSHVPVSSLRLNGTAGSVLTRPLAAPQLAALHSLISLSLCSNIIATTAEVAAWIRHLTALQRLVLINVSRPEDSHQYWLVEPHMHELFGMAATLPQLHSLCLSFMRCVSSTAMAQLSAATLLTELKLFDCDGVDDASIGSIVQSLTGLRDLDVSNSYKRCYAGVSDAVMPVIAVAAQQLTRLKIEHTAVSDEGVMNLRRLKRLASLECDHTRVSTAAKRKVLQLL
eukprot:gene6736-6956_t